MLDDDKTRREAMRLCLLAAVAWAAPRASGAVRPLPTAADEDALDEALARLQRAEPHARQGLSTHAPMAVEALCAMGQGQRVAAWLDAYGTRTLELPPASRPIAPARWREALGLHAQAGSWEQRNPRYGDWVAFFEDRLKEAPWRDVLDLWVARLAPGFASAATHGVIRTAHAARGLARRHSPLRQAELARGLGYWASSYQELPAPPALAPPTDDLRAALARLPLYADHHGAPPRGSFVDGLAAAAGLPGLLASIDGLAVPAQRPEVAVTAIVAAASHAFVRHAPHHHPLAFLHAITGPYALRRLAPHLRPATVKAALPHAWRSAALLYAAYARRDDPPAAAVVAEPLAPAALAERAARHGDEHAIKLCDVLLEQHEAGPDPVLATAASTALRAL